MGSKEGNPLAARAYCELHCKSVSGFVLGALGNLAVLCIYHIFHIFACEQGHPEASFSDGAYKRIAARVGLYTPEETRLSIERRLLAAKAQSSTLERGTDWRKLAEI